MTSRYSSATCSSRSGSVRGGEQPGQRRDGSGGEDVGDHQRPGCPARRGCVRRLAVASTESPPRAKKSSSTPTASTPSTSPTIAASRGFERRRRGSAVRCRRIGHGRQSIRRGDDASVDLAGERERDVIHQRHVLRDHVRGNEIGHHRAATAIGGRAAGSSARTSCSQHLTPPAAVPRPRRPSPTPGMRTQRHLDLAEFDAVAADLDPVVGAADEFQGAVRPVAARSPVRYQVRPSCSTKRSAVRSGRPR